MLYRLTLLLGYEPILIGLGLGLRLGLTLYHIGSLTLYSRL